MELLREGLEAMLLGESTMAKTILRDYISATVGLTGLAEVTHIPQKGLRQMFGTKRNPRTIKLFEVLSVL